MTRFFIFLILRIKIKKSINETLLHEMAVIYFHSGSIFEVQAFQILKLIKKKYINVFSIRLIFLLRCENGIEKKIPVFIKIFKKKNHY